MKSLCQCLLAALLALVVAESPVLAVTGTTSATPLGVVLQAEHAAVGADAASGGATVFDGDRLETESAGALRARLGSSQIYLLPESTVQVYGMTGGYSAELMRGTLLASAVAGQTFQLLADGATIRPAGKQPAIAQVTRVSAKELTLTARQGSLEVTIGGDVKTIEEGRSYRMDVVETGDGPGPQGTGTNPSGQNGKAMWLVIGGTVVGTSVAVAIALMSPSKPN